MTVFWVLKSDCSSRKGWLVEGCWGILYLEEYCRWRPALDVLVLEVDAFHSWYVEPGDVKKALDGGEIMCGALSSWRCLRVSWCGVRGYSMAARRVCCWTALLVVVFWCLLVGRLDGACCLPVGWWARIWWPVCERVLMKINMSVQGLVDGLDICEAACFLYILCEFSC
jgi:hypothetical protein